MVGTLNGACGGVEKARAGIVALATSRSLSLLRGETVQGECSGDGDGEAMRTRCGFAGEVGSCVAGENRRTTGRLRSLDSARASRGFHMAHILAEPSRSLMGGSPSVRARTRSLAEPNLSLESVGELTSFSAPRKMSTPDCVMLPSGMRVDESEML